MKKVLTIDDDLELTEVISFILSKENDIQVFSSEDAIQGLEMAKQINPDLILMDVMLPGLNGAEAVRLIKKQLILKETSVIFFTGLLSPRDQKPDGLTLLVDGKHYSAIPKPFEIEKLVTMVRNKLGIKTHEKHTNNI